MGWLAKHYRVGSLCRHWFLGLALASGNGVAWSQANDPPDTPDKDYSAELPRIAPLSPEDEYKSFEILDGFEIELVAAEPLVFDPIAFAFDGLGRMFVVEMRDYSEQETERLGSIALLTDANGDGKYDKRSTFVEGLSWPTAIWPWRDGVLVAEPPRITWYRDTNGDGVSDQSELWFEGFHRSNVQGLVNSLRWGVDGYVHGTSSSVGADLTQLMSDQSALTLRGRDFSIDPLKKSLTAENGGGQHGMSFNRWGDKFVTSNSDHFQQILELDQWLSKHPTSVAMPSLRKSIAEDGPQAEVFRISPVEPWRIVRTRLRMSGVAPGVVEGGGRAAGYFTGATGTWVMDDEMGFGVAGYDTGFACDVGSNLVHRKKLERKGLFYTATRIDAGTELLRAKDIWFRPVQLGDGPDGALYIADMYREVIEHPKSLPPMIKKHLDLTSGRDKGRIWRLKPKGLAEKMPLPSKWIQQCSNAELVERLASPITWQRRAASQMLVERNATDVKKELAATASGKKPEATILAMHILNRLGAFDATIATAGLKQDHPQVLAQTIALCRSTGLLSSVSSDLLKVAGSQDANVQLQLAMAAADLPDADRWKILPMLTNTKEPLVRAVVATAAGADSPKLVATAIAGSSIAASDLSGWLQLILPSFAKQGNPPANLIETMNAGLKQPSSRDSWLDGFRGLPAASDAGRLLKFADPQIAKATMDFVQDQIRNAIKNPNATPAEASSVSWLGLLPAEVQQELASELLVINVAEDRQSKAIDSLLWSNPDHATKLLLDRFQTFTPGLQRAALAGLLRFRPSVAAIATALESKSVLGSQVPPDLRQRMMDSADASTKQRLGKLLQAVSADRAAVIEKYALALSDKAGNSGAETFQRVCAQCHRLNNVGNDVGPPLKQLSEKSPQQLLETILDPNKEVDPKYANYSVLLNDGRVFAGIIAEESATQIVLAEAGGKRQTIPRGEIEQFRSTGVSLMPTGIEQQITPEQMNDLIQYLKKVGQTR